MINPKMMKQLQEMQAKMAQMQEELGESVVTGSAGGGAVTTTVDGHQHVRAMTIQPEALEEGPELLADMVMAAVNDALDKSREHASAQVGQLTAGLKLPPGFL